MASIENGSEWVARLIKRLKKTANQQPRWFPNDPVDTLRNHVWVSPYYEEDLTVLAERIGVERILFGSDWPHGEGLESPLSFTDELTGFSRNRRPEGHAGQRFRSSSASKSLWQSRRRGLVSEWTIGAVLDAIADVVPDRLMTVCGQPPQHLRPVGGPNQPAGQLS